LLPAALFAPNLASLQGPALAGWKLEPILPALGDRACTLLDAWARKREPFLLYLPLTSPHTPLAVNAAWRGKSGLNPYADFVMETDAVVGRVLDALDRNGLSDNTLVLLTSDNGCAPYIGAKELEARGHYPSGPLRGYKGDAWEGGHRVPFVVRWPGVVKPGSICRQLVQQADLLATLADVFGARLPENAGEDSVSFLPLLEGADRPIRQTAVNCSAGGVFTIRQGSWKAIFQPGPGSQRTQLYDLAGDIGESTDRAAEKPELVAEMSARMEKTVAEGRSTPGAPQHNDVPVGWKR
jgi:arylsulfatase A